jgi:nitrile hydratase subunit beta
MFTAGDCVRTRVMSPPGHTRLPLYLRGRAGQIERVLGSMAFADARANGERDATQVAYTVSFASADLWGADADARGSVCADLFESYLEPVP